MTMHYLQDLYWESSFVRSFFLSFPIISYLFLV